LGRYEVLGNNAFKKSDGKFILAYTIMPTGFQFPGSLSLSVSTISSRYLTDATYQNGTGILEFQATQELADRSAATISGTSFTYYIQVPYDINSGISYHASETTDGQDDAWSMTGISVNKTNNSTGATLNLPSRGTTTLYAGVVYFKDQPGTSTVGTYPVIVNLSLSASGVTSVSSVVVTGSDSSTAITEDSTQAQVLYWPGFDSVPTVDADTADNLSITMNADTVKQQYQTELDAIEAAYDAQDVLASWSISIDAIAKSSNSSLSKHARQKVLDGGMTAGATSVFATGEKIVASTQADYAVSVLAYDGNSVYLHASNSTAIPIYGIIAQS